ncbi:MAG: hypothetical protein PHU14_05980 [Methylovulum sp.]|nr:hypothetical protein [Methylovulum sp.]
MIMLLYILACVLIAVFGINKKFGFWGYFFGSILLTPPIGIILVLASDNKKNPHHHTP